MNATIEYLGEHYHQFRLVCPCGKSYDGDWSYGVGTPILCPCGKAYHVDAGGRLFDLTHLREGDKLVYPNLVRGEGGEWINADR